MRSLLLLLLGLPLFQSADLPLDAARRSLEQGNPAAASNHLLRALEREPAREEVFQTAIEGLGSDPEERWYWTALWASRLAGEGGRLTGPLRRTVSDLEAFEAWSSLRAEAVEELIELSRDRIGRAKRRPDERLVARWARRVGLDLASENPWLRTRHTGDLTPRLDPEHAWHPGVVSDLERALGSNRADLGLTIEIARVLTGLAAQAEFKDLYGPRPSMGRLGDRARKVLEEARSSQRSREGDPWNQDDLEWLNRAEGEVFTRHHDDFAEPGVATSPNGLYRIESECGAETLAGVAATIELHHRRLVNWYGRDPFEETPGLVRVVASHAGLEAEGAPFYWVGGFQGGNTTVVRFALGTIEGLGRLLTHELTHRFDGALYPGQPAWLSEGKAVWTAAAYEAPESPYFLAEHGLARTIEAAMYDGYASLNKLEKLIEGEPEDYRDNYVAGYALYVFLRTWRRDGGLDAPLVFEDRLEDYMGSLARLRGKPLQIFTDHFADGLAGRPDGMVEFATVFAEYLAGFYWRDPQPWVGWYANHPFSERKPPLIRDEPTWSWERLRSEPWFGQDQARTGAELLLKAHREKEALDAFVWAMAVDGRSPFVERRVAELARKERREDSAFALTCELEQPPAFPERRIAGPAPFLEKLPRTRLFLQRTLELAALARSQEAPRTAGALEADAERLRGWLGLAPEVPELPPGTTSAVLDPPGHRLDDFEEVTLAGYDERRIRGLWYVDDRGDLHVGRSQAQTESGFDARARQRHAYARSKEWVLPGTWRLRTRVQFTTSFASGCVVLGSDRRDRDVRFHFSAGDFLFAIGEGETEPTFDRMDWSIRGRYQREGLLPGSRPGGKLRFDTPRAAFDLELLVDGPRVTASINGEVVGSYATPDGSPLEGHIGFATGMGAVRVQAPVFERLDRSRLLGALDAEAGGLDLGSGAPIDFGDLDLRPVTGMPHSVNGSLVLWLPRLGDEPERQEERMFRAVDKLARLCTRADVTQQLVLVVPRGAPGQERLSAPFERKPLILEHDASGDQDRGRRWLFFVDPAGTVRHGESFAVLSNSFSDTLERWIDALRDFGRPERELPALERRSAEEER